MRKTITDLRQQKSATPIVALTAYTASVARIADAYVDILLVGDSLGMVIYGMDSTLPVSLDMMIHHGRAVVNASTQACVVVDMPFGSYQASPAHAFESAAKIMQQTGCSAVKLEGGAEMAETIAFLTARAIPVMGHIGLMPQHVHTMGGYKFQGRTPEDAARLNQEAQALQNAGAFALVLEGMLEETARSVSRTLTIPTIGIGASPGCDGQVLVVDDMLGITPKTPRFVKRYAELGIQIDAAIKDYAAEVRDQRFPAMQHCYINKS